MLNSIYDFKDYVNRKKPRSGRILVTVVVRLLLTGNHGILIVLITWEMTLPRLFILPKQGGHCFSVYKYEK